MRVDTNQKLFIKYFGKGLYEDVDDFEIFVEKKTFYFSYMDEVIKSEGKWFTIPFKEVAEYTYESIKETIDDCTDIKNDILDMLLKLNNVPNFGMFTYEGNRFIYELAKEALKESWDWKIISKKLTDSEFEESGDSDVRDYLLDYLKMDYPDSEDYDSDSDSSDEEVVSSLS